MILLKLFPGWFYYSPPFRTSRHLAHVSQIVFYTLIINSVLPYYNFDWVIFFWNISCKIITALHNFISFWNGNWIQVARIKIQIPGGCTKQSRNCRNITIFLVLQYMWSKKGKNIKKFLFTIWVYFLYMDSNSFYPIKKKSCWAKFMKPWYTNLKVFYFFQQNIIKCKCNIKINIWFIKCSIKRANCNVIN